MKFDLQYFAEETEADNVAAETEEAEEKAEETEKAEKKYTDDDVNKIVDKKFAKWQKELEAKEQEKAEAVEEAKRLAKMNQEEKEKYEIEKMKEELDSYKKRQQYYDMAKEASKMLSEKNIQTDDDLLSFVVKGDAEGTQEAVNKLASVIDAKVEQGVKEALSGNSPRVHTNAGKTLTKEDILNEKDASKRIKMIQDNPNLFN